MHHVDEPQIGNWVARLRGFLGEQRTAVERCELCNAEIGADHAHLVEPASHRLLCACRACALLFESPEARRYRRVARDAARLDDFELSDAQWDALRIPINVAFFYHSGHAGRLVAMYPGPVGTTESTLALDAWDDLVAANPVLEQLEPDVEALLVNRLDGANEVYRVPIDRCYELVGRIRRNWSGLTGGDGPREAIRAFFADLRAATGGRS